MVNRVVVTGLGALSPLGIGASRHFDALMLGQSGISELRSPFAHTLLSKAAGIVPFDIRDYSAGLKLDGLDRSTQFALLAAIEAMQDAGLDKQAGGQPRSGVYIGTSIGGAATLDDAYELLYSKQKGRLRPGTIPTSMPSAAASRIAQQFCLQGASLTFSVACASSAVAIGEAYRAIRHGYLDMVVAGGTESLLTFGMLKAWEAMRTLATPDANDVAASCRPFSRDRSGFVIGEGAAMLVLENAEQALARGATIYAEIVGYGASCDAANIVQPCPIGQQRAMRAALDDAGLAPPAIDYINAHGTATAIGDLVETRAIKDVFGAHARALAISANKSMHGHLMGATGAVEFLSSILSIARQAIPPTMHLREADPECDLDYVANVGRPDSRVAVAMSNSFAFGGANASLIAQQFGPATS